MSWVTGVTLTLGAGRGCLPECVMRKWEGVKCPLGGLGECLLVDLAELTSMYVSELNILKFTCYRPSTLNCDCMWLSF